MIYSAEQINTMMSFADQASAVFNYMSAKEDAKTKRVMARWALIQAKMQKAEVEKAAYDAVTDELNKFYASGSEFRASDMVESALAEKARAKKDEEMIDINARAHFLTVMGDAAVTEANAALRLAGDTVQSMQNYYGRQEKIDETAEDSPPYQQHDAAKELAEDMTGVVKPMKPATIKPVGL